MSIKRVLYQDQFYPPAPPVVQTPSFYDGNDKPLRNAALAVAAVVALSQFSSFVPLPIKPPVLWGIGNMGASIGYTSIVVEDEQTFPINPTVTVQPVKFFPPLSEQFAKPFNAALQRWPDFAPFNYTLTRHENWFGQSPDLFKAPVAAALQRFQDLAPFVPPPPPQLIGTGYMGAVIGYYSVVIEDEQTFPINPTLFAVTQPFGGSFDTSPPSFAKPLSSSLQLFDKIVVPQFASTSIFAASPEQFGKQFGAYNQQFESLAPFNYTITSHIQFFSQSPDLFKTPIASSLQRWPDFAPFNYTLVPPYINFTQSPDLFKAPVASAQQRWPDFVPFNYTIVPPYINFSQSPEQFGKPFTASLQRWPDFAPFNYTITSHNQFFSQSPDLFAKPFQSALQRFPDLVPFGYATIPPYLVFSQSPDLFGKLFASALQRFPDLAPFGYTVVPPYINFSQSPEQFGKPFQAALQKFADEWIPFTAVATPGPLTFMPSPERFTPPLPALLQRFPDLGQFFPTLQAFTSYCDTVFRHRAVILEDTGWPPQTPPSAQTTPTALQFSQSPDLFSRVTPAFVQQFAGYPLQAFPSFYGWWGQSPEQFGRPFKAALQRPEDFAPFNYTLVPPYLVFSQSPDLFKQAMQASLQRFPDLAPFNYTIVPPYLVFSQSPEQFGKPFQSSLQRFPDLAPFNYTTVPALLAFTPSPDQFGRPFPSTLQQFVEFTPFGSFPVPQGWEFQSPEQFTKWLQSQLQQFEGFAPFGYTITTQNLFFTQSPDQFGRPFLALLQRFSDTEAFVPTAATTPTALSFTESPVEFKMPTSVMLQQFGYNWPAQIVPPSPVSTQIHNLPFFVTVGKLRSF